MANKTLEEYLKIQIAKKGKMTGQDLIDLKIIPKSSAEHLGVVSYKRLVALRDIVSGSGELDDEVIGRWVPAAELTTVKIKGEYSDGGEIVKYARVGARIVGTDSALNIDRVGGEIASIDLPNRTFEIKLDKAVVDRRDASKKIQKITLSPNSFNLVMDKPTDIPDVYALREGVVADENVGHLIRFNEAYTRDALDARGRGTKAKIKVDDMGIILKYEPKTQQVTVRVGDITKGKRFESGDTYTLNLSDISKVMEVSTLGQIEPKDREDATREKVLSKFFPRTVLSTDCAERVTLSTLAGRDCIFIGPPGSGKTKIAKDIESIAKQQEVIFTIEGCDMQCNPASLTDPVFAEKCPPCPKCMIKACPTYRDTGIFIAPNPKDVNVVLCKYGEGHGTEFIEGTTALRRMNMAGYKMPKMADPAVQLLAVAFKQSGMITNETFLSILGAGSTENEYDPEGLSPGVLPRTNNGMIRIEEADKLMESTQNELLNSLGEGTIKPEQMRLSVPAHSVVLGTANNPEKFTGPLNDRMDFHKIDLPTSIDVAYEITRRSFHGVFVPIEDVPIENSHKTPALAIKEIPMPVPVERAVDACLIKFRGTYSGEGKREVMGSNRAKEDALLLARTKTLLDCIFYKDEPKISTQEKATYGLQYAFCTRVQEADFGKDHEVKVGLCTWVAENYPIAVKEEEDTWWCNMVKHIGNAKVRAPVIESNFMREINQYKEFAEEGGNESFVLEAHKKVKAARANPRDAVIARAHVEYPFMSYLFREQPGMENIKEEELTELVKYYVGSMKNTKCKFGD